MACTLPFNLNPESALVHVVHWHSITPGHTPSKSILRIRSLQMLFWKWRPLGPGLRGREPRPCSVGGSGSVLVKSADGGCQHTWDINEKGKEVVKVMLFCKLQRFSPSPSLHFTVWWADCLQLLVETVSPASNLPPHAHKLQQGTRAAGVGV